MSAWHEVKLAVDGLGPDFVAVALISARLLPVGLLCPLLGGSHAPMHVKLGLVLSLALFLHSAAGVVPVEPVTSAPALVALAVKELLFGLVLGLISSLPFDAARVGGRFIDLFRGSSAEAALPLAGSKESATGDALYHLLLALAAVGLAMPLWLSALVRSFAWVHLGTFTHSEALATDVVSLVATAFATGLAVGAPIAGLSLAIDALVGFVSRAAPSMNLQDLGAPLRILGGGAVIWMLVGLVAERFLKLGFGMTDAMAKVGHG